MSPVWFVLETQKYGLNKVVDAIKRQLPAGEGSKTVSMEEKDEMEAIAKDVNATVVVGATSINTFLFKMKAFGGKLSKIAANYVKDLDESIERAESTRRASLKDKESDAGWKGVLTIACVRIPEVVQSDIVDQLWKLSRRLRIKDRVLDSYLDLELDGKMSTIKDSCLAAIPGHVQTLCSLKERLAVEDAKKAAERASSKKDEKGGE